MSDADDFEPVSRTWMSQGLTLHYLDWGNEGAPLLIMLHGMSDHARSWDWTARALRREWRVIAPDLRGHGDSQWSPDGAYMTPYHVQDFADLIEHLGAREMSLVAHSFGGAVTLRYAALYPDRVRKLVIVDGLGPAPAIVAKWEEEGPLGRTRAWIEKRRALAARPQRRFASIEEAVTRLMKDDPRLPKATARHLAKHGVRHDGDGYCWKRDPRVSVFAPEDFAMEHARVRSEVLAPTLLFYGPESWTTHPDEDGRATPIRDSHTIVIEEAGHWLHHDQFARFIAAVRAFL